MSRVKLVGLTLVMVALIVTGVGVKDALAGYGYCVVYGGGNYCSAGPGGTCCYQAGGTTRLLRCQCNPWNYCDWVDGGPTC